MAMEGTGVPMVPSTEGRAVKGESGKAKSKVNAQGFPIRNKDVMYVANSTAAELQKFLSIIGSVVFPLASIRTVSP